MFFYQPPSGPWTADNGGPTTAANFQLRPRNCPCGLDLLEHDTGNICNTKSNTVGTGTVLWLTRLVPRRRGRSEVEVGPATLDPAEVASLP